MVRVSLHEIAQFADIFLKSNQFTDWEGAQNGLQMENKGGVTRIAAAVDASMATIQKAMAHHADLLIVHHGLFWRRSHPWTERRYRLIRMLVEGNLAVYSAHLPLDAHPRIGNNARLCAALGLKNLQPFFLQKGKSIGFRSRTKISRTELGERLKKVLGSKPLLIAGGPATCHRIGVVTGGAGSELELAANEGVDTFITGEGPHWTFAVAEELGLNVFYGGHYATEIFGVKALAELIGKKFRLPAMFIDHPSGL